MKGLAEKTSAIIEKVSLLECIKPYLLVGGTALSIQLGTRESEDLDFMSWRTCREEKREVDWPAIKRELESVGDVQSVEILGLDHVEFIVDSVKLSFYANPNYSPVIDIIPFLNNILLADKAAIGVMKMEVMLRRSKFRDYYDIYSLIKDGQDLRTMIDLSLKYSGHRLKSKNLIAMLTRSDRFEPDTQFKNLNPVYDVTPAEIEDLIRTQLQDSAKLAAGSGR